MTVPVFTPPRAPQLGTSETLTYRVNAAKFGDGFEQVSSDGLNTALAEFQLIWNGLLTTEFAEIRNFTDARNGVESFFYTFEGETAPRRLRCLGFQRGDVGENADRSVMRVKEVVDL